MERKDKLIDHRFILKKVDLGILHSLRSGYEEVREEHPEIKGLSFYGSRTKGRSTHSSDIDVYLFYNGSEIEGSKQDQKESLRSVRKLLGKFAVKPAGQKVELSLFTEDISVEKTNILFDLYSSGRHCREWTSNLSMISRFFLGVGQGLYTHRAYILNALDKRSDGEVIFQAFMSSLKSFERGRLGEPIYDRYPESIREAKDYFQLGKTIV